MALDPRISLGVQPMQLPDPLAQYGKVAALQQAQNQNALAQYQLGAAQRAEEKDVARTNALAQAGTDDTAIANALLKSGDLKGYSEFVKSRRETQKAELDLFDTSMKQIRDAWGRVRTPEDALAIHEATHRDPIIERRLRALGVTEDMGRQNILDAAKDPAKFSEFVKRAQLGADEFIKLNKPTTHVINQGGQSQVVQLPGLGGAPTTVGTYGDVPVPAAVEEQKKRIAAAGRSTTNVVNVQEKAEAGEFGKLLVNQYKDISERAAVGARTKPALESNLAILDKGFDTGFGTETKASAAKVLAALGVKDADKYATNAQTFLSNASQAVLQKQLEQKGPQTESDAARIQQIGAQLGNTKSANKAVLEIAKEQINRDIEQRKFYDDWKKKTGSFQGAEDAWFSGEGGKSLFDRPTLKKYVEQPKQPQGLSQDRRKGLGEIFGR